MGYGSLVRGIGDGRTEAAVPVREVTTHTLALGALAREAQKYAAHVASASGGPDNRRRPHLGDGGSKRWLDRPALPRPSTAEDLS